ncbi:hypothetical protein [Pseudomonas serbica]|uniref:hypothetical protein n=1 Tax=Pseudomonas serbica TaxID=2965074 RepID=UPI00237A9093|nr:hypothetical protein [Pseudomonas serbica]
MDETNAAGIETTAVKHPAKLLDWKPKTFGDFLLVGVGVLLFAGLLWAYIAAGLDGVRTQERLDELRSRSPAHDQILTAYYQCTGRMPSAPLSCLGSVSKGAEMSGIKPEVVKSVLVDAGITPPSEVKAP